MSVDYNLGSYVKQFWMLIAVFINFCLEKKEVKTKPSNFVPEDIIIYRQFANMICTKTLLSINDHINIFKTFLSSFNDYWSYVIQRVNVFAFTIKHSSIYQSSIYLSPAAAHKNHAHGPRLEICGHGGSAPGYYWQPTWSHAAIWFDSRRPVQYAGRTLSIIDDKLLLAHDHSDGQCPWLDADCHTVCRGSHLLKRGYTRTHRSWRECLQLKTNDSFSTSGSVYTGRTQLKRHYRKSPVWTVMN